MHTHTTIYTSQSCTQETWTKRAGCWCLPPKGNSQPQLLWPHLTPLSDSCWCLRIRYKYILCDKLTNPQTHSQSFSPSLSPRPPSQASFWGLIFPSFIPWPPVLIACSNWGEMTLQFSKHTGQQNVKYLNTITSEVMMSIVYIHYSWNLLRTCICFTLCHQSHRNKGQLMWSRCYRRFSTSSMSAHPLTTCSRRSWTSSLSSWSRCPMPTSSPSPPSLQVRVIAHTLCMVYLQEPIAKRSVQLWEQRV